MHDFETNEPEFQTSDTPVREPPRESKRKARLGARDKSKRQPPYAVVLHNDPINGFDYVVRVLQKVFGYGMAKAIWLTMKAHVSGQTMVWTGALEVAELKREQIQGHGPDPEMRASGASRLSVSLERMPQ